MTVDTNTATIYGDQGITHYSIMDGSVEIYDPEMLTASEYTEAVKELESIINDSE